MNSFINPNIHMKKIYMLIALVCLCSSAEAKSDKKGPSFNADGTFKVLQFTDTHIRTFNVEEAQEVYDRIDHMVKAEKPDLIVFTGDVILVKPAAPEWNRLVKALDSYEIPWVIVYGNHDAEQNISRAEMSSIVVSGKYTLNTLNEAGELADLEIPVMGSNGKDIPFYVYAMDSHDYAWINGERYYAWFTDAQVQWLRNCCLARTDAEGKVAPSMAFFHIPLREYIDAWSGEENPREEAADNGLTWGVRGEKICAGAVNSGMFAAMLETGSVIATSVGHDHCNDFMAAYHGILLCYGRFSGGDTTTNYLPHGAKIFKFFEGTRNLETWVREDDDRIMFHGFYDGKKITHAKRNTRLPFGTWFDIDIAK